MTFELLPVYAYKELDGSVSIYKDNLGKDFYVKYDKHHSSKPTKRNKRVMLNCYQWQLNWITARITTFDMWYENRMRGY